MSSGISRDRLMSRNELSAKLNSWIPIFIYCAEKSTAVCLQTLSNSFFYVILEKKCWLCCLVILYKYAAERRHIARCKAVLQCTCTRTVLFRPAAESAICGFRTVAADKHIQKCRNETDNACSLTNKLSVSSFITC